MKEKAELLLEVERLSVIRDELTSDVTELHESLEKERSKVSKLKEEIQVSVIRNEEVLGLTFNGQHTVWTVTFEARTFRRWRGRLGPSPIRHQDFYAPDF